MKRPFRRRTASILLRTLAVLLVLICVAGSAEAQDTTVRLQLRHRLTAPEPLLGVGFGDSVEAFGDYIAVSEPNRPDFDSGISSAGQVYLFDLVTGALLRTFHDPEPGSLGDSFGAGLAIGDGKLFVGDPGGDSLYSFDLGGGNLLWSVKDPPIHGVSSGNGVGRGLAFSSGTILATAASYQVPFQGIFGGGLTIDATSGEIKRFIDNPEPQGGDALGVLRGFDIFDGKVALGSISDCQAPGQSGGCVWIFDEESGDMLYRLDNPTPKPLPTINDLPDWFGVSVAVNAEMIVVGDRLDEVKENAAGGAYVFDAAAGLLLRSLYSPHPQSNEEFGRDVDLTTSNRVWVGADGSVVNGLSYAGRAYLFDGVSGQLLLEVTSPNASEFSLFGHRITAWGDMVAITAAGEGAVYIYTIVPEPSASLMISMLILLSCLLASRSRHILFHSYSYPAYSGGGSRVQTQTFD